MPPFVLAQRETEKRRSPKRGQAVGGSGIDEAGASAEKPVSQSARGGARSRG